MFKGAQYIGNHLSKLQVWEVIEMATVETEVDGKGVFMIFHCFKISCNFTDKGRERLAIENLFQ